MRHKSEVCEIFPIFWHMVNTQFSLPVKTIRSDNGGEYLNSELLQFFHTKGILHETTCPHTPQQNGVAEHKNRHILETTRALLIGAHVPQNYWVDAVTYAVYLINRMPSQALNFKTPLQTLTQYSHLPSLLQLEPRVFGCVAYVHLQKTQRTKLDPCAVRCIFLGFNPHQKGYRCYHPSSHRLYGSMDVTFSETECFFLKHPSSSSPQGEMENDAYNWIDLPQPYEQPDAGEEHPSSSGEEVELITTGEGIELSNEGEEVEDSTGKGENEFSNKEAVVHYEITPSSPQIHVQDRPDIHEVSNMENSSACTLLPTSCYSLPPRQNRGKPPDRYSPNGKISYVITKYLSTDKLPPQHQAFVHEMENIKIPTKIEEALQNPKWAEAMEVEMDALHRNGTWSIVSLPLDKKKQLVANGYSLSNREQMGKLIDTSQDW